MTIPRKGDLWEFKKPGKPKRRKIIDYIAWEQCRKNDSSMVYRPFVHWKRRPKGRYTQMRVKWLLKNGKLIERNHEEELLKRIMKNSAPTP